MYATLSLFGLYPTIDNNELHFFFSAKCKYFLPPRQVIAAGVADGVTRVVRQEELPFHSPRVTAPKPPKPSLR